MLDEFITSALIIDDKEEEINQLQNFLESKDIWVKHYTPDNLDEIIQQEYKLKNRKIIFLDLHLDEDKDVIHNASKIRKYFSELLGCDFGSYGIVLWTKHTDDFNTFKNKLYLNSNGYTLPLFMVAMDKNNYLNTGNYENILKDLEEKLKKDIPASFFIEWNKAVKKGSDSTITSLYNLFDSIEDKEAYLEATLYNLALSYTGTPEKNITAYKKHIQKDLVKSLIDNLQSEINKSYTNIKELFKDLKKLNFESKIKDEEQKVAKKQKGKKKQEWDKKYKIFSKLNSMLLIDSENLSQTTPLPGNIYYKKNTVKDEKYFNKLIKTNFTVKEESEINTTINKIITIEITPPCDFSNSKKQERSRIIQGFMLDYNEKIKDKFKSERFYKICPLSIKNYDEPQMIVLDFYKFQTITEKQLSKKDVYEIAMKAKNNLFADILQKLSSHMSRLGLAILEP